MPRRAAAPSSSSPSAPSCPSMESASTTTSSLLDARGGTGGGTSGSVSDTEVDGGASSAPEAEAEEAHADVKHEEAVLAEAEGMVAAAKEGSMEERHMVGVMEHQVEVVDRIRMDYLDASLRERILPPSGTFRCNGWSLMRIHFL